MGHISFNRYQGDVEKYNEAAFAGWRLFRLTKRMIDDGTAPDFMRRLVAHVSEALPHDQKSM